MIFLILEYSWIIYLIYFYSVKRGIRYVSSFWRLVGVASVQTVTD